MKTEIRASTFLDSLPNFEKTRTFDYALKLDRMKELLRYSNATGKNSFKSIVVAGSKGKGSVAATIESLLRSHGFKTGFFSSPHLECWRERIKVDGNDISEESGDELAAIFSDILRRGGFTYGSPTYFEVMTAMALYHFRDAQINAAVLEVGLGGEFDATNASGHELSVITPIGLEHQDILGRDISDIARAKCGILRNNQHAVISPQTSYAMDCIKRRAKEIGAKLILVEDEINIIEAETGPRFFLRVDNEDEGPFEINLLGRHQLNNAATAFAAVREFLKMSQVSYSYPLSDKGFRNVKWPGRIEKVADNPAIVLDGAHNEDSAKALFYALKKHFSFDRLEIVLGMLRDKNPNATMRPFESLADRVWVTEIANLKSFSAKELKKEIDPFFKDVRVTSLPEVLRYARTRASGKDLFVITGSLYLVGEAKKLIKELSAQQPLIGAGNSPLF